VLRVAHRVDVQVSHLDALVEHALDEPNRRIVRHGVQVVLVVLAEHAARDLGGVEHADRPSDEANTLHLRPQRLALSFSQLLRVVESHRAQPLLVLHSAECRSVDHRAEHRPPSSLVDPHHHLLLVEQRRVAPVERDLAVPPTLHAVGVFAGMPGAAVI